MIKKIMIYSLCFGFYFANAQVDSLKMNIDFRTRTELDNGQKTLIPKGKNAETTIFSRARIGLDYYYQNLEMYFSAQDVRIWGETASTQIKNQNFTVNEAWAKYQFNPKATLKIGRQILSYDNERLVGALDWAMQGRSFDALKGIFSLGKNSKVEAVVTYNNDGDDTNDTPTNEVYGIADSGEKTKSLQLLHYQYKDSNKSRFSVIAMNNVLQNADGTHYDMLTAGVNAGKYFESFGIFGSGYYQTGNNTAEQSKKAYQFSLNADFIVSKQFNIVVGTEWLSGNNYDTAATENRSFSPMYGTNHKFNGFMDYFYVGNHFNTFGLNDYYIQTKMKFSPKSNLTGNIHAFITNGKQGMDSNGKDLSKYLGTELDLVFQHKLNKQFGLFIGHSFMFASESMNTLKNVRDPKNLQTWTWLALHFNPSFKLK